ncbi:3-methyl-2-oxobutanoate hydroxymethyltransferase [Niveomyces insectorum RCEF 264]|uniref:3-methyl-2-oxobutanoate hydroxymethyltransferase n=1 Tax=Niveomyces insectorum RCEF 264 TaxID=1081102 RepID=A0A167VHZ8_9HYPO|nr:3-methyl-2-oxobutanoate hydroxymethyltransferase [Niveomyces insectorum RCEF 264]
MPLARHTVVAAGRAACARPSAGRSVGRRSASRLARAALASYSIPFLNPLVPRPFQHPVTAAAAAAAATPIVPRRASSHSPMGAASATPRKKVTLGTLRALHAKGEPIAMLTAHDFPSAHVADAAGMDIILVGDSLAMVALGMEDTSEVTVDEMLLHCRSVARATKAAFTVGDLPMGSYEIGPDQALATAIRFVKEGRVQAIKLEGGREMAPAIARITASPCSPTSASRRSARTPSAGSASRARPPPPPSACSPTRAPCRFVKQYGDVWGAAHAAVAAYRADVKSRAYPEEGTHTYPIAAEELAAFEAAVRAEEKEGRQEDDDAASKKEE